MLDLNMLWFQMEWFSKSHRKLAYVVSQVVGHGTGLVFPVIVYFNRYGILQDHFCIGHFGIFIDNNSLRHQFG